MKNRFEGTFDTGLPASLLSLPTRFIFLPTEFVEAPGSRQNPKCAYSVQMLIYNALLMTVKQDIILKPIFKPWHFLSPFIFARRKILELKIMASKETLGVEVESLASLQSMSFSFEGAQGFFARTEETGMANYELFAPLEVLLPLWTHLLKTGEPAGLKPIGKATRKTARIEAGLPRLGPDINERIVPPEANPEGIAFGLTKGCYPGQEVVARMDTYGSVKRRLEELVIEGTEKNQPETGAKLFSGTREVGWVSSATFSPLL